MNRISAGLVNNEALGAAKLSLNIQYQQQAELNPQQRKRLRTSCHRYRIKPMRKQKDVINEQQELELYEQRRKVNISSSLV